MSLSPAHSPAVSTAQGDPPRRKRIRLSLACNQCRKRKVRCDTTQPKCRNCVLRNEHCETSDPRNPSKGPSVRSWATKNGLPPPQASEGVFTPRPGVSNEYVGAGSPPDSSGHPELSPSSNRMEAPPREKGPSWLERAYHASNLGNENNPLPASTPELVVNTDETSHRVKYLGGSSVQCLCRFVDLHLAHKGLEPASSQFKHGMEQSEEIALPLVPTLPELPPPDELATYKDLYFERIWPLFPVVDLETLQADIDVLCDPQRTRQEPLSSRLTPTNIPSLVSIYAIISIGIQETNGRLSHIGTQYLTAAYSLYAHLVATPYMSSVQALVLLAIALRGQVKDGLAWHMIGQAIRIAHSIGLHKQVTQLKQNNESGGIGSLHKRLWWTLYGLEKLTQLESGRPSIIDDRDEDQVPSMAVLSAISSPDYFTAWISLARIMGQISELLYSRRPQSSLDLFSKTGRLDMALVDWERSWADSLRLSQDAGPIRAGRHSDQHLSNFLSLQFYYAHITLLRVAIIFPQNSYNAELAKLAPNLPSYSRMLNGATICASAARSTITQTLNLVDQGIRSLVLGATPPYLAAVVLALSILRQPTRRLARADLELLNLVTEHLEDYFSRWVPYQDFIEGCALLRRQVNAAFNQSNAESRHGSYQRASGPSACPTPRRNEEVDILAATNPTALLSAHGNLDEWPDELFEGLQFDELWRIMDSDFLVGNETMTPS